MKEKKTFKMKKYQKKAVDQTGNDASDQNPVFGNQQGKHLYSNFFLKSSFYK